MPPTFLLGFFFLLPPDIHVVGGRGLGTKIAFIVVHVVMSLWSI
jgi:hypothetical protein